MKHTDQHRAVLQPVALGNASGLKKAGAIVANVGVSDTALVEMLSGRFRPAGTLPFALAHNLQTVIDNQTDAPGYTAADTLFPMALA